MNDYGGIAGLIELTLAFGAALSFVGWQIIVTRRGIRADREEAARRNAAEQATIQAGTARSSSDASP